MPSIIFFLLGLTLFTVLRKKKKKVSQVFYRYAGLSSEAGHSSTSCSEIKGDENKDTDTAVNPTCNQTG